MKVSVIIPCHNAVKWLPKCFLSLVTQTIGIENLELIFVDDASDDAGATWAMLQEFEAAYPQNILVIHLDENMRQGGARNAALSYVTGEYIAFVDADDFVAEDFLEKVYGEAVKQDADIVQFQSFYYTQRLGAVRTGGEVKREEISIKTPGERKTFLISEKITYGCWNKLYRRTLIEKAKSRYAEHVIYEEPLFVYPLLFYADKFVILPEAYYFYRQNEGGTMRSDMKERKTLEMHAQVQLAVWNFMKQTPFFAEYYEEIKLYFLHTYFYETLLFGVQRGFGISLELYHRLRECVEREVKDYDHSSYESLIPKQMELYRAYREAGADEVKIKKKLEQIFECGEKQA